MVTLYLEVANQIGPVNIPSVNMFIDLALWLFSNLGQVTHLWAYLVAFVSSTFGHSLSHLASPVKPRA